MSINIKAYLLVVVFIHISALCSADDEQEVANNKNGMKFIGRMIEQGRTLVHHAVKRFMIILPAIFFKLGIAFTLLLLVTIVAINNGFIGFLLLVVGLSSVLARLQETRRPAGGAYIAPLPPYYHHANILDRSDSAIEKNIAGNSVQYLPSYQYYGNSKQNSGYNQLYYGSKQV